MDPTKTFRDLTADIRKGPDEYDRQKQVAEFQRRIKEAEPILTPRACRILLALLAYYFSQGVSTRREVVRLLRREVRKTDTPDWLRFRCLVTLAALTYKDPRIPFKKNLKYRFAALRLAKKNAWYDEELIILNNLLFAYVEEKRFVAAEQLLNRVQHAISRLDRAARGEAWYTEAKGRFAMHEARLLLRRARSFPTRTAFRNVARANQRYRKALRLEGSDTNRRVNILVEWAESLLRFAPNADPKAALRILGKASRSFDSRVSDLTRAFFYKVRGHAGKEAAGDAEETDVERAVEQLKSARNDLRESIRRYRKTGHQEQKESDDLLREVEMKLAEYRTVVPDIRESLAEFRKHHPNPSKVAFVMMQFSGTILHRRIFKAVKEAFKKYGIVALRADQRPYHDALFPNVRTYIHGCGFGVAIFERIESEVFNPNVALEVGYMLALKKPVCLLKERTLRHLHTDLVGQLYNTFDAQDVEASIERAVSAWLRSKMKGE